MSNPTTELRIAAAVLETVDTLTDDFDPRRHLSRFADRSVQVLRARAAGVMLLDGDVLVPFVASTAEQDVVLDLMSAGREAGPALDSLTSGKPVPPVVLASEEAAARWPAFAARARGHTLAAAYAVPLRRGEDVLGALSVFVAAGDDGGGCVDDELAVAQMLGDAAALGLFNHRAHTEYRTLAAQLREALASRIRIEQAKGMLAERWGVTTEHAFSALRYYARSHRQSLHRVAEAVVDRRLDAGELTAGRPGKPRP